jgi:hypothetical protein
MSEPTQTPTATTLNVSEEVQKKFPDLVEMIKGSQSMNQEERQYWVDVLLIMGDDQIQNLRNILENEKKQIETANQTLQRGIAEDEGKIKIHFDEIKYREKKRILKEAEGKDEEKEKKDEAALLQEIGKM